MTIAANAPGALEGRGANDVGAFAERTLSRCAVAARAASTKLGRDILVLNVEKLLGLTDAFLITSGTNPRQVRTISDEVERQLKVAGNDGPVSVEGLDDARWVLMDYGDFVVHVFLDEARQFFDLEHLWGDAPTWSWDEHSGSLVGSGAER
ncbi:MAG TPA: ribosome silencing factor [Acidimicrobiales bacterium]|nr:ribosome silencing factor [Acidimicrobiales bacterium]